MPALTKWLRYFSPLFAGRFDFHRGAAEPTIDAWARGLALSRGRFWIRVRGGHDIRRASGRRPTAADTLVARTDGPALQSATFPWIRHAPATEYWYAAFAVGFGGVTADESSPLLRASFDAAGNLRSPLPNAPTHLSVTPTAGGRFGLRWRYVEAGQEAAPQQFDIFNDAATPGTIDYSVAVATIGYRPRAAGFEYLSDAFAHGTPVRWAVRARSAAGDADGNIVVVDAVADAAPPAGSASLHFGPQLRP